MSALLWVLATLGAGCTEPPPPPPPPVTAEELRSLVVMLDEARERARAGDPEAAARWAQAHAWFEARVEPLLRARHPPEVVAEVEYGFARIRAAMDADHDAGPAVDALAASLQELVPTAPPRAGTHDPARSGDR